YETLDGIARWLVEQGVPQAQAADYVAGLVAAWGAATAGQRDFARLRAESQTRGGLNEQAMALLAAQGHFARLHETLDAVLARLTAAERSEK
ncbi:MAG: F420-dependent NADP oxidoreductase, partial [Rhodospirillaceae bacterium]|nr:F420-dependent NADP oxidoreductase [Rhodospirillaceae bacterium]